MRYAASIIGIDGQAIGDLILETVEYKFGIAKGFGSFKWLADNGSCWKGQRESCLWKKFGAGYTLTPIHSPESNGMAGDFVDTSKRDYVWFGNLSDERQ